jgi:hypothetical protein
LGGELLRNESVEREKKGSGEKDNVVDIPNHSGLERAQGHEIADDKNNLIWPKVGSGAGA